MKELDNSTIIHEANNEHKSSCCHSSNSSGNVNTKESCCIRNKNTDRLTVFNWLKDIKSDNELIEVKFKSTRKLICLNVNKLDLSEGDLVSISANPGHDIGVISLVGELVHRQITSKGIIIKSKDELPKIYRIARDNDLEKWEYAKKKEHDFLLISRSEADRLNLNMKIGDVECQGDGTKAIFYYIAEERVDFRELIKVLASKCCVRIEMKQIGARQEAGRTGGLGNCGRELCCSSWKQNFTSVTNVSVREQGLSLNPSKITGQCAKLKCCMMYELDSYIDMKKELPKPKNISAKECRYLFKKLDVLQGIYSFESDDDNQNFITLTKEKFEEYTALNEKGIKIKNINQVETEISEVLFTSNFEEDNEKILASTTKKKKKKKRFKKPINKENKENTPNQNNGNSNSQNKPNNNPNNKQDNKSNNKPKSRNGNDNRVNKEKHKGESQNNKK